MRRRPAARLAGVGALALAGLAAAGCGAGEPVLQLQGGGDSRRGPEAIEAHGCGSCHLVPGVRGANGLVAPPLTDFGQRVYIAGALTNTPEHLVRWIMAPQDVEPGTAMPDLGVSEEDARDIAAYLLTLGR